MLAAHAHRDPTIVPEDPRMRAYWKFHVDGQHKTPREGPRPDHLFVCSWCDSSQGYWTPENRRVYDDREVEKFILPDIDARDPFAAIRGRLG
jgi:hypothetical protein